MNEFIFRKYDIRGIVATDFTDDVVINLGKAFGTFVKRTGGHTVALSGDVRDTTPHLKNMFAKGLISTGINVKDLGIIPTPTNYYSMYHLDIDGAVQITGSHNPPEFNGFKMSLSQKAFYGEQIQDLNELINMKDFEKGEGKITNTPILNNYMEMLKSKIKLDRPLKIVMDCGNAAGCLSGPQVYKELGIELTELYCDVDPTFPNHHPDPAEDENLTDIIKVIKEGDFDFGVAFDGDADRVILIDEKGGIIRADNMMCLFLPEIIKTPGEKIVFDVKCSQALEEMIVKYGGTPIIWKTGHSLIKEKMRKNNVRFAGEMSGHIFFADDFFGFDDAIYVGLRAAQTLSRTSKKLSELTAEIPKYYSTPEMRLDCPTDQEKFDISEKAVKYFTENFDCETIDGVRIRFEDGWGLVRSSNTQPVIVTRFEAKSEKRLNEIKKLVLDKLIGFGEITIND
ncbi:MAG: phosphomannomutase/phosphoglucomutase [Candidatus Marinimicrobia bacterium]|nr:phosphomannomutase/phosphoglucomutase [Candidatus Neomarinimicrobiota bacterium]